VEQNKNIDDENKACTFAAKLAQRRAGAGLGNLKAL
jgi:hypothetical protein